MSETVSADGTRIAFDRSGVGPPVILVVGAFNDRSTGAPLAKTLEQLVSSGGRGDAVELFQTRLVGIPEPVVVQMRNAPFRPALEAIAHTLVYEAMVVGDRRVPTTRLRSVTSPTLALYGAESPAFMGNTAKALAEAVQHGEARGLDGQSHDIVPSALAPILLEFFAGG